MQNRRTMPALAAMLACAALSAFAADVPSITVSTFEQEICTVYTSANGLPSDKATGVAVTNAGIVYAGTEAGLCVLRDGAWQTVDGVPAERIWALAADGTDVLAACEEALYRVQPDSVDKIAELPDAYINAVTPAADGVYLSTSTGLYLLKGKRCTPVRKLNALLGERSAVNTAAVGPDGSIAVAADAGLFFSADGKKWEALTPAEGSRSWAPFNVRGVAFDADGNLWAAFPTGVCQRVPGGWRLYTGAEGLPYNDFTAAAAGEKGVMWFATRIGAIRYNGQEWMYRQGRRWLPDDFVRAMCVTPKGDAWFATEGGVGVIERKPMTLAEKAKFYEDEIDKYNRRTEYGYVLEANLEKPGDKSKATVGDSDNDGLWTSMYGAGECYAYAATKDPKAKERAVKAFEALRFLSIAPIDGEVKQQPGFVARTVVPTTEANPNDHYTIEKMEKDREGDKLWKVYYPRWPKTKDGKYWYKTDTSSDELDGHYYFYALYYDLVAETPEEKERVREIVRNLTDHLARNDFQLVDHDGTPTRWSVFSPSQLNRNPWWMIERGLNSLSMLSYLTVAQHMTGDAKYGKLIEQLREKHGYDINAMVAKIQRGPGSGNQSDDEMAIMSFYNLIRYTQDEKLREMMNYSFYSLWVLEFPELNPFFNFAYAACGLGAQFTNAYGTYDLTPWDGWLEDSAETLRRFPLDRFNWGHRNSHRLDIVPLKRQVLEPQEPASALEREKRGHRVNGKVLPVDERHFNHWNTNPWELNYGGNGQGLADGAVFLLPYYMGLYHGYIK
ncbi:MAG: hypothetical protein IT364_20700 [Candidatus Hydrogenedentes bacterium]|nr:hypothetical protein [Candidatus Hydrogenedentota bacterium]